MNLDININTLVEFIKIEFNNERIGYLEWGVLSDNFREKRKTHYSKHEGILCYMLQLNKLNE